MRAAIAGLVLLGPLAWLHRHRVLNPGWHPLLVLSTFSVLTLLAGVAGHLRLGAAVVVAFSLALLAWELRVDRRNVVDTLRAPSTVVFLGTAVALVILLRGQVVTHYDNFSHWALVVSVMLDNHALPTPSDDVVTFTTYPLGAASLLYLANVVIGRAEATSMIVQGLFTASCALPLVTAAGRRVAAGVVLYVLSLVALLSAITAPTSLLVDSLVAALAGALFLLVLLDRAALLRAPWTFGVLAAALLSVKTSGLLFVAVATVVVVLLVLTRRPATSLGWSVWAGAVGFPWLVWWLWGWHVNHSFSDAAGSKHSVSAERFGDIIGEKSPDDVRSILEQLAMGTVGDILFWFLLAALVVVSALALRAQALTATEQRRLLIIVVSTVVLWEISLALMYLYSMPLGEALSLAGFGRYQGTMHLVVMLLVLAVSARWCAQATRVDTREVIGALAAVSIPLVLARPDFLTSARDPQPRTSIEQALAQTEVEAEDTVCVLLSKTDSGYRGWMVKYLLQHGDVGSHVIAEDESTLPERVRACDQILLLDDRPHTHELLRDAGWPVSPRPNPQVLVIR